MTGKVKREQKWITRYGSEKDAEKKLTELRGAGPLDVEGADPLEAEMAEGGRDDVFLDGAPRGGDMSTDDYTKYLEDMEAMFERLEEAQDSGDAGTLAPHLSQDARARDAGLVGGTRRPSRGSATPPPAPTWSCTWICTTSCRRRGSAGCSTPGATCSRRSEMRDTEQHD